MFAILLPALAAAGSLDLPLRTRVQAFKGSDEWKEVRIRELFPTGGTAILICDMWDNHWCKGAAQRVNVMVKRMAPVVEKARSRGVLIIHSPSDTMEFYKDTPQRQRMLEIEQIEAPPNLSLSDPPLPIDDSDGGCDTPETTYRAWTRQHPDLRIAPEDVISDKGPEIYSLLRKRNVKNLLVMGVHTNMCVLNRTFAIKQMTRWGIRCVLVRDLTDAMYDPRDRPFVPHDEGTSLVVQHIEKHWCPTVLSADLLRALREAR
jgi:nicotinamidase-related amidase